MQVNREMQSTVTGAFVERIPDNVLLDPIDYIFADHCRQADLCAALKSFAANYIVATPDLETAAAVVKCLDIDFNMHIADEEIDLFPRLRARAQPDDHFSELLRLLDREHERDGMLAQEVRDNFARIAQDGAPRDPDKFRRDTTTFAATHLSHLNWENAVVLPLARKRLTHEDLTAMGHAMAARRSIPYPAF